MIRKFLVVALPVLGLVLGAVMLFAPVTALAAPITCNGNVLVTAEFDTPAINEYRLAGTGPGLPSDVYMSSDTDPESFSWLLNGPGSWDIVLEWRRPPVVPDWAISQYNDNVVLTCIEFPTPTPISTPELIVTTVPPPGPLAVNLLDGRINSSQIRDIAAPVAIYFIDGNIDVWLIDAQTSEGTRIISYPQVMESADVGLLASAQGVSLYWLEDSRYQLNAPNFEGNLYSITWQGCNSSTLEHLAP